MPINKKEMSAMKKEYGEKKGEQVYFAKENKEKSNKKHKTSKIDNKLYQNNYL